MTPQTARVLEVFLAGPTAEHYGFELTRATCLQSGSLYPILARLEAAGVLESDWETSDTTRKGARRRYYRLSREGSERARRMLARHDRGARMSRLRPAWRGSA